MGSPRINGLLITGLVLAMLAVISPVAADTDLPIGGQAQIVNTGGDGIRVREQPDVASDTLKVLDEGWRVQAIAGPVTGSNDKPWYKINHAGTTGYVMADFLTTATGATGGVLAGETAQIATDDGAALRLRQQVGGDVISTMPNGALVPVLAGPTTDDENQRWFQVRYADQQGWALGAYLRPAPPAAAQASDQPARGDTTSRGGSRGTTSSVPAAPSPAPPPPPAPTPAPARSGGGGAILSVAQQYIGAPYVFGGSSPGGFDCSGFTSFVVMRALGISIGHSVGAQWGVGTPVATSNLQPGDLVFFRNTYMPGLSHVGIYAGGGVMINAQSESTGVRSQYMWDSYWGSRYVGARRIA